MRHHPPLIITGTDTGAGKTWASLALMAHLQQRGLTVVGMKPVASGCLPTPAGLRNSDALLLQQHSSVACGYADINPYAFVPAIAPHFAAEQTGQTIDLNHIIQCYQRIQLQCEQVIIEGVGGWAVPFNDPHSLQHWALALDAGVILVVGLRLGCINHALLSVAAILRTNVRFVGWLASQVEAEFNADDSLAYLCQHINLPYLGCLPHCLTLSPQDLAHQVHWL